MIIFMSEKHPYINLRDYLSGPEPRIDLNRILEKSLERVVDERKEGKIEKEVGDRDVRYNIGKLALPRIGAIYNPEEKRCMFFPKCFYGVEKVREFRDAVEEKFKEYLDVLSV